MRRSPLAWATVLAALLLALLPVGAHAENEEPTEPETVTLSGTVRYTWGAPVPNHYFTLALIGGTFGSAATTDGRGEFTVELEPGTYTLDPGSDDPYFYRAADSTPTRLTITGATAGLTVNFPQPPIYRGTVTWKNKPIGNAPVTILAKVKESQKWNTLHVATTDAAGRFEARPDVEAVREAVRSADALRRPGSPWTAQVPDSACVRTVKEYPGHTVSTLSCTPTYLEKTWAPNQLSSTNSVRLSHADSGVYTVNITPRLQTRVRVTAAAKGATPKKKRLTLVARPEVRHRIWTGGVPAGTVVFAWKDKRLGRAVVRNGKATLKLRGKKAARVSGRVRAQFVPADATLAPSDGGTKVAEK